MKSIVDILNRPPKPFNINDFGGLGEDEYLKDEIICCKKCNTPRMFAEGNFRVRCICKCQAEAKRREEQEKLELEKQAEIEKLQKASLMGVRYRDVTFDNTVTKHNESFDIAFNRCKKYCAAADKVLAGGLGIYMYGDKGTGKTHLTACMANDLIKQRKQVLFTNFAEISKVIRGTFGKASGSEEAYTKQFANIDFLFIDDLGTERVQAANGGELWLQEKIFDILNMRYNNKKPTIFTSNHSIPELITERGIMDKTVDRIVEMSSAILKIEGDSYRMKKRTSTDLPF